MLFGGVTPEGAPRRAPRSCSTRVGLGDRIDHKPTELSGGQMQRVAIARALAMNPDIILADEPTGNLDTTSGSDIMSLFTELWKSGRTLVIITHDPALAESASRHRRDPRRADHAAITRNEGRRSGSAAFSPAGRGGVPPPLPGGSTRRRDACAWASEDAGGPGSPCTPAHANHDR